MSVDSDNDGGDEKSAHGADLIIPALGSGLAIYYLVTTAELDWEAKSAGLFVGTVLLSLCAIQLVRTVISLSRGTGTLGFGGLFANTHHNRQRFGLLVLVALFIATIGWMGTTLGLFLLLIGCMLVMGVREPVKLVSVALGTAGVVYVMLIYLLNSRLPRGIVEKTIAAALGMGE